MNVLTVPISCKFVHNSSFINFNIVNVGGVCFCTCLYSNTSVDRTGTSNRSRKYNPVLLPFLSICLSFTKLWCENKEISWERKRSTPCIFNEKILRATVRPSTIGYNTKCVQVRISQSWPAYKPQHTPVTQWYQNYCVITLVHFLLPVTVMRRLPFTLLFLTSFLLAFFWPKLTTSVLGLIHLTLPMM
jgi:hypothetical protein